MKKLAFLTLLPAALFLSGCSNMGGGMWGSESGWSDYDYHNQMVDGRHLQPGQYVAHDGSVRTYKQPRQYHVTTKDVETYNAINDRVAKRKAQLQQKSSSVHMDSTNPASAQSVRPTPANGSYNSSGETNY